MDFVLRRTPAKLNRNMVNFFPPGNENDAPGAKDEEMR
jgi:hypothetical protein